MAVLDNHSWQYAQAGKTLIRLSGRVLSVIDILYVVVFIQNPVYCNSHSSKSYLCLFILCLKELDYISRKKRRNKRQLHVSHYLSALYCLTAYIRCPVFTLAYGSLCAQLGLGYSAQTQNWFSRNRIKIAKKVILRGICWGFANAKKTPHLNSV